MEDIVVNSWWAEAVEAAGYTRSNDFWYLMKNNRSFNRKVEVAIRKSEIVRKVWRRIKRREVLRIIKATKTVQSGWVEV